MLKSKCQIPCLVGRVTPVRAVWLSNERRAPIPRGPPYLAARRLVGRVMQLARRGECAPLFVNPQGRVPTCRARSTFRRALSLLSQRQFHSIIGDAHVHTALLRDGAQVCENFALVAGDNFRAAVRDNSARNPLFLAPRELCPNRRVTDERFAASANERAHNSRAIADVNLHTYQCRSPFVNVYEIRRVENARTSCAHAIADRRRKN